MAFGQTKGTTISANPDVESFVYEIITADGRVILTHDLGPDNNLYIGNKCSYDLDSNGLAINVVDLGAHATAANAFYEKGPE